MSPADELERAEARLQVCQTKVDRLERENAELRRAKGSAKAKPRGKLDAKGAGHAAGVGVVCAPVGAWTEDMVGAFYTGVDEVGGSFEALFRLQMMEDLVGLLAGFVAGTVAAAVWKTLKRYGPPEQT